MDNMLVDTVSVGLEKPIADRCRVEGFGVEWGTLAVRCEFPYSTRVCSCWVNSCPVILNGRSRIWKLDVDLGEDGILFGVILDGRVAVLDDDEVVVRDGSAGGGVAGEKGLNLIGGGVVPIAKGTWSRDSDDGGATIPGKWDGAEGNRTINKLTVMLHSITDVVEPRRLDVASLVVDAK